MFVVLKFIFFTAFNYQDIYWEFLYWAACAVIAAALVRRLGVINFLEAIFAAGFWFVGDLFLDFFIILPLSGLSIFRTPALWGGYLTMVLFVFFMHKKRHVHLRKQLHGHH